MEGLIYLGGSFTNRVTRWDGTQFNSLGATLLSGPVYGIYAYSPSNVYIGGAFSSATFGNFITKWNGSDFNKLGATGYDGTIWDLNKISESRICICAGQFATPTLNVKQYLI